MEDEVRIMQHAQDECPLLACQVSQLVLNICSLFYVHDCRGSYSTRIETYKEDDGDVPGHQTEVHFAVCGLERRV